MEAAGCSFLDPPRHGRTWRDQPRLQRIGEPPGGSTSNPSGRPRRPSPDSPRRRFPRRQGVTFSRRLRRRSGQRGSGVPFSLGRTGVRKGRSLPATSVARPRIKTSQLDTSRRAIGRINCPVRSAFPREQEDRSPSEERRRGSLPSPSEPAIKLQGNFDRRHPQADLPFEVPPCAVARTDAPRREVRKPLDRLPTAAWRWVTRLQEPMAPDDQARCGNG